MCNTYLIVPSIICIRGNISWLIFSSLCRADRSLVNIPQLCINCQLYTAWWASWWNNTRKGVNRNQGNRTRVWCSPIWWYIIYDHMIYGNLYGKICSKNITSFCILQSGKVYGRLKKLIYPFGLRQGMTNLIWDT